MLPDIGVGKISDDVQFSELMAQLRHLGTIRFAMLGVFAAITAGLLAVHGDASASPQWPTTLISAAGIVVALLFAGLEVLLSHEYSAFASCVIALEGQEGPVFRGARPRVFGLVTCGTLGLYGFMCIVWVLL